MADIVLNKWNEMKWNEMKLCPWFEATQTPVRSIAVDLHIDQLFNILFTLFCKALLDKGTQLQYKYKEVRMR